MATGTGWTVRDIDATPWPDLLDLLSYWGHHPPVHVLVRSFFREEGKEQVIQNASEADLRAGIADLNF